MVHDKKITIHDKNITNRLFFCSLGTTLTGMRLSIACAPVQCSLQAFPYPFGTPATPFTVSATVRRSSRHRRSSGDRAGSRQLQKACSVFGPCDARRRPVLQQAAPHSQYEVGRTEPSTRSTPRAPHCVRATEGLGAMRHSRWQPPFYGSCRCPDVKERLQGRASVVVSPCLPVDVCLASYSKLNHACYPLLPCRGRPGASAQRTEPFLKDAHRSNIEPVIFSITGA